MLTHATHSWPHQQKLRHAHLKSTKTNNYPYKFFSWRWQRSQPACIFLVNFSYIWTSEKPGGRGVSQGCQIFDPWDARNLLVPSKVSKVARIDWYKTICSQLFPLQLGRDINLEACIIEPYCDVHVFFWYVSFSKNNHSIVLNYFFCSNWVMAIIILLFRPFIKYSTVQWVFMAFNGKQSHHLTFFSGVG